jgi:hypothetical protein
MKILKALWGIPILFFIGIMFFGLPFFGCTKTKTIHDTTTVIVKDTINTKDTITLKDTINICTYDLSQGLIGYYNFNGGNLNDSSGHNNNIFFNSATMANDRFVIQTMPIYLMVLPAICKLKTAHLPNPDSITLFAIVEVNGL